MKRLLNLLTLTVALAAGMGACAPRRVAVVATTPGYYYNPYYPRYYYYGRPGRPWLRPVRPVYVVHPPAPWRERAPGPTIYRGPSPRPGSNYGRPPAPGRGRGPR